MKEHRIPCRARALARLPQERLDVLVIGGGIVGAGVARDGAMRGLKVGLVEQHDFAYGTSSRSSRLLHGGLRYLAQGRVGLVREASLEKKVIHRIAPHLAQPLSFIFPTYKGNKHWVLWQLKAGVKLYDLLCGGRNLGRSTWLSRDDTARAVPGLRRECLNGAVRYFDGFTNDARLTLDTIRSAEIAGAHAVNYCRFVGATRSKSGDWDCELLDVATGRSFETRAVSVVNATGPWAEKLPNCKVKLRATKGVHLVVDHARVPVIDTVVMSEGKRILFAIPWGERTILGTTDTDYSGEPEAVRTAPEDMAYILGVTNEFFPAARLGPGDVISSWAGLRPLVADPNGKPSDISRSHEITESSPRWFDVTGGKLTTYRLMAEQVVDRILQNYLPGVHVQPCRTAEAALLTPAEVDGVSGILPPACTRDVVHHYCLLEWAANLDDVMVRRTSWHYYYPDANALASKVAAWMSEALGWTEEQRRMQLRRYLEPHLPAAGGCKTGGQSSFCAEDFVTHVKSTL